MLKNKADIVHSRPRIHQALRQERQDQLQDTRRQHPQHQLKQFTPVRSQITEEKRQAFPCPCILLLAIVKVRSRLEEQGKGTSVLSCPNVTFTPIVRNPIRSAASLMPNIDTPSRVMNACSRRYWME